MQPRQRWITPGVAAGLVLAVLALYWPVRGHGFVSYDDEVYLTANPHVAGGLDWDEVRWVFTHDHAANYHPLTWVSHMLDVELFGLAPGPHHLVGAALHALNAVLAFLLMRALLPGRTAAGLGAALWALHPLRVESVAWAAERKDLLCGVFFLAGLLLYLRYARAPSPGRYSLVSLALCLALLAKPMAVTFPCVALLLDVWPLKRLRSSKLEPSSGVEEPSQTPVSSGVFDAGRHPQGVPRKAPGTRTWYGLFLEKIPLFLLAALGALSTWLAQEVGGAASGAQAVPHDLRALNALATYGVYLAQTLWPAKLAVFYPLAAVVADEPRAELLAPALAAALALVTLSVLAWRSRARRPWFLGGWCWYLGTLVPVIGLKQVGAQAHADRYTYLPLIGIAWIAAGFAAELGRRRARLRVPVAVLSASAVVVLGWLARVQLGAWRDTRSLFEHALEATGENHVAHASLGAYWLQQGDLERARSHLDSALAIYELDATALTSLGRLHLAAGELDEAEEALGRARRIHASKWVRYHLGELHFRRGELERAAQEFEAALALDPSLVDAHMNLGQVLLGLDRSAQARGAFEAALALDPGHAGAHNGLGVLALDAGDPREAERLFALAVELDPAYADALNNLGVALERQGRTAEARARYAEARALYESRRE